MHFIAGHVTPGRGKTRIQLIWTEERCIIKEIYK